MFMEFVILWCFYYVWLQAFYFYFIIIILLNINCAHKFANKITATSPSFSSSSYIHKQQRQYYPPKIYTTHISYSQESF